MCAVQGVKADYVVGSCRVKTQCLIQAHLRNACSVYASEMKVDMSDFKGLKAITMLLLGTATNSLTNTGLPALRQLLNLAPESCSHSTIHTALYFADTLRQRTCNVQKHQYL